MIFRTKMSDSINKQKILIVDAVLDLKKKLNVIESLPEEAKLPENKVALKIFDELFEFVYLLVWESVVINVSWLYEKTWYEKNGNRVRKNKVRSLYWYIEEQKKSFPNKITTLDSQVLKIDNLEKTITKVRSIRNKWIAHRDKKAFLTVS